MYKIFFRDVDDNVQQTGASTSGQGAQPNVAGPSGQPPTVAGPPQAQPAANPQVQPIGGSQQPPAAAAQPQPAAPPQPAAQPQPGTSGSTAPTPARFGPFKDWEGFKLPKNPSTLPGQFLSISTR